MVSAVFGSLNASLRVKVNVARKRRKLYVDTSILGYALHKRSASRRREANLLLRQIAEGHFVGAYSFATEAEIDAAQPRVAQRLWQKLKRAMLQRIRVVSRARAYELAARYCDERIIPEAFFLDALHVAVATLWRADALVSYNFKHLVRLDTMLEVNRVNRGEDLAEIFLCQPREVVLR